MDELIANPIDIAGLAEYQTGSVVSRTIIKKNAGTVTVFAFEEGEGLSEHTAPFDAMALIVDGEAQVNISGKPQIVSEGQMIIMPANQPHSLKALKRFKMVLTMIREQ